MSDRKIKVQREVSERPINVERESTLMLNATGVFPSGTLEITENGEHDVTTYKTAEVDVPTIDLDDYFHTKVLSTSDTSVGSLLKKLPPIEILSGTTNISSLFAGAALEHIEVSGDVSQVTTASYCFGGLTQLKFLKVVGWKFQQGIMMNNFFRNVTHLETLIIDSDEVFLIEQINLMISFPSTIQIYVPDDLVDTYKTTSPWSGYSGRIKPLSELPEEYRS